VTSSTLCADELREQYNELTRAFMAHLADLHDEAAPSIRYHLLLSMRLCKLAQANLCRLGYTLTGADARHCDDMARLLFVLADCEQAQVQHRGRAVLWPELEPLIGDMFDVAADPMVGNRHAELTKAAVARDAADRLVAADDGWRQVGCLLGLVAGTWESAAKAPEWECTVNPRHMWAGSGRRAG
jgi:hypothetical protein